MLCNVCRTPMGEPIYQSRTDQALTSLCEIRQGQVRVWACPACAHLCGVPLPDTQSFYESDYRILLNHEDEDQIYEVRGERIVYRCDHQLSTLLDKLALPPGTRLLDYGCAKAAMPKRLLALRPDLDVHLFDVSDMYRQHWTPLVSAESQATHHTPDSWRERFDVVTSFFAFEHIPDPCASMAHVTSLLRDGGVFYGIVPDTFGNPADFVVIDHVNHFTPDSLRHLLGAHGFTDIDIDAHSHRGALVFSARKGAAVVQPANPSSTLAKALELARYWEDLDARILRAESVHRSTPAAIYGSGFYGAYIACHLAHGDQIRCFLDRSPFQQGKTLFGKPVLAPEQLPQDVRMLYVGLNPAIARSALSDQAWMTDRDAKLIFFDAAAA